MPKRIDFTELEIQDIVARYSAGVAISTISKDFHVSDRVISRVLKERDVWKKSKYPLDRKCKYVRDSNFFETSNWLTHYWLGFIAADGCVKKDKHNRKYLDIRLSAKDADHLRLFAKAIQTNQPVLFYISKKGYRSCCLNICDRHLVDSLLNLGIMYRKSLVLSWPLIDKQFEAAFMLGYFDGDGCWTKTNKRPKFNVVGSKKFVTEYQKVLCRHLGLKRKKIQKVKNAFCFEYTGDCCFDIAEFFYTECQVSMGRKKDRFLEIWNEYRTRGKVA